MDRVAMRACSGRSNRPSGYFGWKRNPGQPYRAGGQRLTPEPTQPEQEAPMSLTSTTPQTRHLALVDTTELRAIAQAEARLTALENHTSGPIPADVLDRLAELDADQATADDVLELAAADVDTARKELMDAAHRLAEAEERFARAGIVADETSRAAVDARHSYGVSLTATGYRKDDTR
jgi:MoxR-like ATPase